MEALVDFVLKHRRGKVFKDMSEDEVRYELARERLVYATGPKGEVIGLVVYRADHERRMLFIRRLLTTSRGVIRHFTAKAREWYPGFTLAARRREQPVTYERTPRLLHLLEKMT